MALKVLVVRFSSIGDIVLTTPVIRVLSLQLGAEVHFLTKKSFKAVLEGNPYVQKLWTIEKDLHEIRDALRNEKYDRVIDLHNNLRTLTLKWFLMRPSRSFNKLNFRKWLFTRFGWDTLPALHIVDRYLETVADLGAVNDGRGLDFFIPAGNHFDTYTFLQNLNKGDQPLLPLQPYIALVIGAAHATKRLPVAKLIDLVQRFNYPVVLLGGPDEKQSGDEIAAAGPHVLNACGACNLHGSAALVRDAAVVITHDTGLMHIAAAFQKPILSVWGNTVPAFGMYPYYGASRQTEYRAEVTGLSCRPCSKIGHDHCPKGHFRCMEQQPLEKITATVQDWLNPNA